MDNIDYVASCCSVSISFLQVLEANDGSAGYELIKARWMLASRMVELRKFRFALKEFKTMKRRLEVIMGDEGKCRDVKEGDSLKQQKPAKTAARKAPAEKENVPPGDSAEKDSSRYLEFPTISTTHEAVPYVIKCQLGILHCALGLKRPDLVEVKFLHHSTKHIANIASTRLWFLRFLPQQDLSHSSNACRQTQRKPSSMPCD